MVMCHTGDVVKLNQMKRDHTHNTYTYAHRSSLHGEREKVWWDNNTAKQSKKLDENLENLWKT